MRPETSYCHDNLFPDTISKDIGVADDDRGMNAMVMICEGRKEMLV